MNLLVEHPKFVTNTVSNSGDSQGCQRVEIACCQTAQSTVADRLLQCCDRYACAIVIDCRTDGRAIFL